ncbi:unnamed protein product [Dovyalis caffra]|uniref:Uncharacterized protein n=1 Tax=Dovyalis caffra TaxID=77055 RepID=A0AAV1RQP1_9ROSI|nr:unnamed protein product [Dovyalis caffra]
MEHPAESEYDGSCAVDTTVTETEEAINAITMASRAEKVLKTDKHPRNWNFRVFDGEGADSWIFRAERYFSINRLSEVDKLGGCGMRRSEAELLVLNPKTLKETIETTGWIERKNQILSSTLNPKAHKEPPSIQYKLDIKSISWTPTRPYNPFNNPSNTTLTKTVASNLKPITTHQQNPNHGSDNKTPTTSLPPRFQKPTPAEAQAKRE